MDAARHIGLRLATPLRSFAREDGLYGFAPARPCAAGSIVMSVPFRSCLFSPSTSVLSAIGLQTLKAHRRPFLLAPNTFAAACTVAHRRPRSLSVPALDPDPAMPPLPPPRPDTDLDTVLGLVIASIRYRVGLGLPIPTEVQPFLSYLARVDGRAAGCNLGMLGCEAAITAAMTQHALNGLAEETLTTMIAERVLDPALARDAAPGAMRPVVPSRSEQGTDELNLIAACAQLFPAPTLDMCAPEEKMSPGELYGYALEILQTAVSSGLHDARRRLRFLTPPRKQTKAMARWDARMCRDGASSDGDATATGGRVLCFVPYADVLNHDENPNCALVIDPAAKAVHVRALRRVASLAELTVKYDTAETDPIMRRAAFVTRFGVAPP